ncbi:MAG TPA: type II secretion system inner membrane protein GspF [Gammaproteobacteria bacterium]|nr:type II secretion system inner membrane protein GspF [Gammaproteobacteria bacterium]
MGAYVYKALDARGRERKGVLEGDTPRAVRQKLREQGLTPLEVTQAAEQERAARSRGFGLRRGISATELALVTRQLATLVRSALPLDEALQAVAQQSEKPRIRNILLAIRARVMEGHTLAYGIGEFPHVFPEIFRATVAAGEQTGHLDAVLERLADYAEKRQSLQQRLSVAMIYPVILVIMAFGIITAMLAYVVPRVVTVFADMDAELPALTRWLIAASDFLTGNWIWLVLIAVAIAWGTRRLLRQPGPKRRYHHLLLRLPMIGRLTRGLNTARFARTLAILAGSGVPVLESLRIAGEVVQNIPMREAVDEATARIREGTGIARALEARKVFPPMTIHLIASGETSGQLEQMLERAADAQEREMETLLATFLGVLEPALILGMGLMVLIIVLAILLPIFELNQLVG